MPIKERTRFIFGQLFQANMQQHGSDGMLMFADMIENERYSGWYADIYIDAMEKTKLAVIDAFTPRPGQLPIQGPIPKDVLEGIYLTIAAGVIDSCISTAINSQLMQWKAS